MNLKQGSINAVTSIYPKAELPRCFASKSVASLPDSNESCHQEAEGISCPHKGREHRRCEGGNHMGLKHEAKYNASLTLQILRGE